MANGSELGKSNEEQLSKREILKRGQLVFGDYAQKSIEVLNPMVRTGEGRYVLGSVPGRPEDEQLGIDAIGENVLGNLIRDYKLPALVLGEHNVIDFSNGTPQMIITIDAFDNSSEYKRGLDTPVYTVIGSYTPKGEPISSVISDIKDRKAYIHVADANYLYDLVTKEYIPIKKSERTTIKDEKITIASYLGSNEYSLKFWKNFGKMIETMAPKGRIYANGGSFIYGLLASGAVDAYVMFDEPHSEILPGLPLAFASGCTLISVNEDGSYLDYRFNPEFIGNPDLYTHGTVPLFIAAATVELAEEIINYYMQANNLSGQPRRLFPTSVF